MKRVAVGLIAMCGLALGAGLSPAAALAEAPSAAAPVADAPGVSSSGIPAVTVLQTLLKCLTSGSSNPGTPGSTQTGCLNS
ncbi:hypothetical protein ABZ412_17625 [Nocardia sp. NPDC005746]|uniref:hypothetical protein n=1 Tax=Nocardia sp. NPDC005746 TaxID=3157062 RepID=UPI0033DC1C19